MPWWLRGLRWHLCMMIFVHDFPKKGIKCTKIVFKSICLYLNLKKNLSQKSPIEMVQMVMSPP